jgi:hypothetical protein
MQLRRTIDPIISTNQNGINMINFTSGSDLQKNQIIGHSANKIDGKNIN